jgi:flagellar biosynthetic protein FliR
VNLNLFVNNFQFFLLVFLRIAATLFVAPVFASMLLRPRMKVFIAFFVALIILLPVKKFYTTHGFVMPSGMIDFGFALINEIMVGLAIGFFLSIIFSVFQLAGQLFSIQIGFGISEVIDPLSQIQIPLIGQFQAILGTLIFFSIDGHLMLFQGLMYSFQKLPVINMMNLTGDFFRALKWAFVVMFATALKIGLPIMGSLFLVTLCMGLLAKAAPQMNILMLGFPIYIFVGFTTISYLMPGFLRAASAFLRNAFYMLFKFFAN